MSLGEIVFDSVPFSKITEKSFCPSSSAVCSTHLPLGRLQLGSSTRTLYPFLNPWFGSYTGFFSACVLTIDVQPLRHELPITT